VQPWIETLLAEAPASPTGGHVTEWLEFHDSALTAVSTRATHVEILLDAYIHRWERLHNVWKGTGWSRSVRILVSSPAAGPATPPLPVDISDGRLEFGAVTSDGIVGFPFQASGVVRLWLQLVTADIVEVTGSAVRIEGTGPGRYIEDLPRDWRPPGVADTRS
jgi:hypothetical protein